jgi:hypothetical protein
VSNEAYLIIGGVKFRFEYEVPPYVVLLFDPSSYFEEYEANERNRNDLPQVIGYRAVVAEALAHIDALGLGRDQLAVIYQTYKADLLAEYLELLQYELLSPRNPMSEDEVRRTIANRIGDFAASDPRTDVDEFGNYLRDVIDSGDGNLLSHPADVADQIRASLVDFPPAVVTVSGLFETESAYQYDELVFLLYLRTLMAQLDAGTELRLEVQEVVDRDPAQGKQIYKSAIDQLAVKLELSTKLLGRVVNEGTAVHNRASKNALTAALHAFRVASTTDEKAKAFEAVAQTLFSLDPKFKVKRVVALPHEEEVDLVVVNDRSLIIVECKNWSRDVGSTDIREFAGKLRNNRGLSSVGIFIAGREYSSEATEAIWSLVRDECTVVLLTLGDVETFVAADWDFASWLGDHIVRL